MSHSPNSPNPWGGDWDSIPGPPPTPETLRGLRPLRGRPAPFPERRAAATWRASDSGGDATCFTSTERLLATHGWHRLVEQRARLLTLAGTVTPGIFACATRPRRLVKGRPRQLTSCHAPLGRLQAWR